MISKIFNKQTKKQPTQKRKMIQDDLDTIFKAAAHEDSEAKVDAMNYFGMNDFRSYNSLVESNRIVKKRKDNMFEIAKQCVDEFVHGEECTRIDTNRFKFAKIGEEKHPCRMWNHMCWSQRLDIFHKSNTCEKCKAQHPWSANVE